MSELTMGSLFAGTGGFELAAERNGIKPLWNCEIDELKRQKLKKNFPDVQQYADIRDLHYPQHVDILTGGFPCQDISSAAGHRATGINGQRSGLWKHYARLLGEVRPSVIVFENSPRIVVSGLEQVLCDLARHGYDAEWRPFYAAQFGYNHYRKRTYGVAFARSSGWESCLKKGGILEKVLSGKNLPPKSPPEAVPTKRYDRHSDYESVRMDDGFSKELDKFRIHDCGNAVVVDIPQAIFYQLKLHWPI
jgi:DNA (cytosine-5)-methyltransferase 1